MDKHEEILKKYVDASISSGALIPEEAALKAMQEVCREQPLREALEKIVNDQPLGGFDNSYHRLKNIARTALAGEGELKEEERERVQKFDKTSHDNNSFIL